MLLEVEGEVSPEARQQSCELRTSTNVDSVNDVVFSSVIDNEADDYLIVMVPTASSPSACEGR